MRAKQCRQMTWGALIWLSACSNGKEVSPNGRVAPSDEAPKVQSAGLPAKAPASASSKKDESKDLKLELDYGVSDLSKLEAASDGSIFLAGTRQLNSDHEHVPYVAHFDGTTGALLWKDEKSLGEDIELSGLTLDKNGAIVVVGVTRHGSEHFTENVVLAKFSPVGNLYAFEWKKQYPARDLNASQLLTDSVGNIFLRASATYSAFGKDRSDNRSFDLIAKFNSSGELGWVRDLDKPGRAALDRSAPADGIYLFTQINDDFKKGVFRAQKLDGQTGKTVWTRPVPTPPELFDIFSATFLVAKDSMYICGGGHILKGGISSYYGQFLSSFDLQSGSKNWTSIFDSAWPQDSLDWIYVRPACALASNGSVLAGFIRYYKAPQCCGEYVSKLYISFSSYDLTGAKHNGIYKYWDVEFDPIQRFFFGADSLFLLKNGATIERHPLMSK